MNQFDGHPGTAKLAQVLDKRTSQKTESPLTLDFGEIQANGSLKTNTFPVPIPKGDYTICRLDAFNLGTELAQQSTVGRSSSQPQRNDTGSESRRSSAGCLDSE